MNTWRLTVRERERLPRKKRVWYPGATYHVMSRGNRRTAIYKDKADYCHFLDIISMTMKEHAFRVHSICMMTNHFHMEIETSDTELWRIMQKIKSVYAEEFNHRHKYTGHLFEGRYAASLIEDERYFLEVSRYIHLNPVKAMMVREPLMYKYSSYSLYVSGETEVRRGIVRSMMAEIVDTGRVLGAFPREPREQYRMFVEGKISHAEQETLIMKDMKENELWLPW